MKVVFSSISISDDLVPMLTLAKLLKGLGVDILFLSSEYHINIIKAFDIEFFCISTSAEYCHMLPDTGGVIHKLVQLGINDMLTCREYYLIESIHRLDKVALIVTPTYKNGATLAAEKYSIPLIRIVSSPEQILESIENKILKKTFTQKAMIQSKNRFRKKVGMPLTNDYHDKNIFLQSTLVLGLYPDWFVGESNVYDSKILSVGFPYINNEIEPLSDEIKQFVSDNGRPVVFMPGTNISDPDGFFEQAKILTKNLGCPAIFMSCTTIDAWLDKELGILYHSYTNFNQLLPLSYLLVHSGGIGSTQAAMRAGIPQIIVPRTNTQLYNAKRARAFGSAAVIAPKILASDKALAVIQEHIEQPLLQNKRLEVKNKLLGTNGIEHVTKAITNIVLKIHSEKLSPVVLNTKNNKPMNNNERLFSENNVRSFWAYYREPPKQLSRNKTPQFIVLNCINENNLSLTSLDESSNHWLSNLLECYDIKNTQDSGYTLAQGDGYITTVSEGAQFDQDGSNQYWPYPMKYKAPGPDLETLDITSASTEINDNLKTLWQIPAYCLFIPSDTDIIKLGLFYSLRSKIYNCDKSKIDMISGCCMGSVDDLFFELKLNSVEILIILQYSFQLKFNGNRSPFTLFFSSAVITEETAFNNKVGCVLSVTARRKVLDEFIKSSLAYPSAELVNRDQLFSWLKAPQGIDEFKLQNKEIKQSELIG